MQAEEIKACLEECRLEIAKQGEDTMHFMSLRMKGKFLLQAVLDNFSAIFMSATTGKPTHSMVFMCRFSDCRIVPQENINWVVR